MKILLLSMPLKAAMSHGSPGSKLVLSHHTFNPAFCSNRCSISTCGKSVATR